MEYKDLFSEELITIPSRKFYINKNGVANSKALTAYTKDLTLLTENTLIYIGIDLSEANKKSRSLGDYTLGKLLTSLKFTHIFHLYGGKYVILCEDALTGKITEVLNRTRSGCMCYFAVMKLTNEPIEDQLLKGYEEMTKIKSEKQLDSAISGTKNNGTIPEQFLETVDTKYINTMWFNEYLILPSGEYQDARVTIYPLEYNRDKCDILVIVSSEQKQRAFAGKDIKFGYNGTIYSATGRFTRDGKFDVVLYATNNKSEITTKETDGIGIPDNFGKKIGDKEVFPFRTIQGNLAFVVVDNLKPTIYETDMIEIDGETYHITCNKAEIKVIKA